MSTDFSWVFVGNLLANLVGHQLTFFNGNGVRDLDWDIVANFLGLVVTFSLDNLTHGWFAYSFGYYRAVRDLNLSCNLHGYLSTNMLDFHSTMGSWSVIIFSFS